jgi:hypothetical protein
MTPLDTLQTLVRNLSAHGGRPAILTFRKHTIETRSFIELSDEMKQLASGLLQAGLCGGEPVAIYSPNRPEWIIACMVLLYAGAVPVPIDSQMAGEDLVHVIEDCEARRIITVRSLVDRLTALGLDQGRSIGATALARGYRLVWFPEGGRSPDGTLQPVQSGIGLMMTAHPVPIIPVWIEGSFEALPTGAWWPRRQCIRVRFGESLNPNILAGQSHGADRYRRIAAALHDCVAALGSRPI